MPKKPDQTIRELRKVANMDPSDIHSDLYADGVPIIAETDLSVTVLGLCRAGQHADAAKAIELAVRRAYQVEAAV